MVSVQTNALSRGFLRFGTSGFSLSWRLKDGTPGVLSRRRCFTRPIIMKMNFNCNMFFGRRDVQARDWQSRDQRGDFRRVLCCSGLADAGQAAAEAQDQLAVLHGDPVKAGRS